MYLFGTVVGIINNTDIDRLKLYVWLEDTRIHGKEGIYMWSLIIMQLKFYLVHTTQMQFVCTIYRLSAASGLPHNAASICI